MKIRKIFFKNWPDGSRMKISFIKLGGPIISIDTSVKSEYSKEIEENEKLFYLKKLDEESIILLEKKGFKEVSQF